MRVLARSAAAIGAAPVLRHDGETAWASVTFAGTRHRVAATGDGLGAWLTMLADADLPMRGRFVASVDVAATPGGAMLTVLVLEE